MILATLEKKTMKQVFLTQLDQSSLDHKDSVLLGDWCINLADKDWVKKRERSLDYHWNNRIKFSKDYIYINTLNSRMLKSLAFTLNKVLDRQYPLKFWNILLGPWLTNFNSALFDRWETINKLLQTHGKNFETKILTNKIDPPKDLFEFRGLLDSDYWNHIQFSKILLHLLPDKEFNKLVIETPSKINTFKGNDRVNSSIFMQLAYFFISTFENIFKQILNSFNYKKRYVIFEPGFHRELKFKIFLKLRSIPFMYLSFRRKIEAEDSFERSNFNLEAFEPSNPFELFLLDRVKESLPMAYLEKFQDLETLAKREFSTKKIITAYSYWYNEFFKIWAGLQSNQGSKLIILEHGGSFELSMGGRDYLEEIADINVSWGVEKNSNYKRLPPNKLYYSRKTKPSNNDVITLFDYENVRFGYRAVGGPTGPLVLDEHLQKISFLKLLPDRIMSNVRIKPKYLGSWNLESSYKREFGSKVLSSHNDLPSIIDNSKLIISGYPQTSFSEAMFSRVPSMLLITEELWDISSIYSDLLIDLKAAKILHGSPISAAEHLIDIYQDIEAWWNEPKTIEARNHFDKMCNTVSDCPSRDWVSFIKSI